MIRTPPTRHALAATLSLALTAAGVRAQEPQALVTDRPDQTESAVSVPAGLVQLELGWTVSREAGQPAAATIFSAPGTLARVGVGHGIELRAGVDGWYSTDHGGGAGAPVGGGANGFGDALLGLKWAIDTGSPVDLAFLAGSSVPIGAADVTSGRWDPAFLALLAHPLTEAVGLGYNLGVAAATESTSTGRETTWAAPYSVALGFPVAGPVGAFVEAFGAFALSDAAESEHSLDGGFTLGLTDSLQLDLSGGVGLDETAPDWFVGSGASVRVPR